MENAATCFITKIENGRMEYTTKDEQEHYDTYMSYNIEWTPQMGHT